MKVLHVYMDTSVIGGCFDAEFAPWSNGLMEDFRAGTFHPVVSELVATEIRSAPEPVRVLYAQLLEGGAEFLAVTDDALNLMAIYQARSGLAPQFSNDLLHIALATIADTDVLVSWNFKHIVRFDRIRVFNAVNLESGYKSLAIYSPREVTLYGTN